MQVSFIFTPFLISPRGKGWIHSSPALLRRSGYAKAKGEGWDGGYLGLKVNYGVADKVTLFLIFKNYADNHYT